MTEERIRQLEAEQLRNMAQGVDTMEGKVIRDLLAALKEAREDKERLHRNVVAQLRTFRKIDGMCHEVLGDEYDPDVMYFDDVVQESIRMLRERAEAAEAQAAQAREAGYREAVEDAIKFASDYTVAQDDFYKAGMLFAEDLREALLTAPETPAGVEEIGETCNETVGNRPFVRVEEEVGE